MKITTAKLASQRFTTVLLGFMFCWFAAFPYLIKIGGGKQLVKTLNHSLLIDWFMQSSGRSPGLKFWFIGLGLLMGLLTLNLAVCTWQRFAPKPGWGLQKQLLFLIHLIFALLLAGHGLGFIQGWRPEPIKAYQNETITIDQHHQISINEIIFNDNPDIFKKPRQKWNRNDFSYEINCARIILQKDNEEILQGNISIYNPLQQGSMQVTLLEFIAPKPGSTTPGIRLQVSRAPFAAIVIWLFHGMISLTFIYILSITKLPGPAKRDQTGTTRTKLM